MGCNPRVVATLVFAALFAGPITVKAEALVAPYDRTVETRIRPQIADLLDRLAKDGRRTTIDGVPVFNGDDKFLPGKIALGLSDVLTGLPSDDPRTAQYVKNFRKLAKLTVDDPNDSWGIYYYLSALNQLRRAGLLAQAVDRLTLAKLRVRLDWRSFVDVGDLTLIDHPNNYYCVALAIARLRHEMGWEDAAAADKLFAKLREHYREFSGPYGFADETDGEGRFDRYSVLLSAELAQRYLETGVTPPSEDLDWLRRSAEVMLLRLNPEAHGFEYGRSLGPYAETALVETLTAAAVLGLLTPPQKDLAYAYVSRSAQRYVDFWIDARTGSVDLWDHGRRTDAYRGKYRILGENLSLAHQYIYTSAAWSALGYRGKAPAADFAQALDGLPKRTVTWFARGDYDRMLLTLRDRGRVIGLPVVNGGTEQHMHNPYFPIPFSPGMLAGVADGSTPELLPQFTLTDGTVLAPLAFFRDVKVTIHGETTVVSWRQDEMDRLADKAPIKDARLSVVTTYVFSPGRITRTDVYTPKGRLELKAAAMEFAVYSGAPVRSGRRFVYGDGVVREFRVAGLDDCQAASVDGARDYQTPTGPLRSRVRCVSGPRVLDAPFTISWSLTYQ